MPILSVSLLSKSYHNRELLRRISFSIDAGDRIALIGENGAGKTTLFRMIEGRTEPDQGNIIFHGKTIVGYLAQSAEDQDTGGSALKSKKILQLENELSRIEHMLALSPEHATRELLSEYATIQAKYEACGGYDFEQRMLEILTGLGLSGDDLSRPMSSLSGGERMRVALARLIVQKPDLLLLDEPTNHLDADTMEWLEDYLKKQSAAIVLISHDRYFIDKIATRIFELENGDIHEYKGNYSAYVRQKDQFLLDQRQVVSQLEKEVVRQAAVTQTMLSHRKMTLYHSREKVVAKLSDKLAAEKAKLSGGSMRMSFSFVPEKRDGDPDRVLIKASNVSKSFQGEQPLFQKVSFEIKASDKLVLVGPNGCGKTTLLTILLGQQPDFGGDIYVSSSAEFGYMGQFIPFEDEDREIIDELLCHVDLTETEARNLLARFGFRDIDVFKKLHVLSGGERSRLFLCCLLQQRPDVLFLDEPTNHLDIRSREILENALADYTGAVVAVSHDRYFIEKCGRSVLGFSGNSVLRFDDYSSYRASAKVQSKTSASDQDKKKSLSELRSDTESTTAEKRPTREKDRAQERRDTVKRKERLRDLEKEIAELEKEKEETEAGFSKDTMPEDYAQYADLCEKITSRYDEFILVSEEIENSAH